MFRPTIPISPYLRTRTRVKPSEFLTPEERENQLLDELKKHQFKAKPFNKKIVTACGTLGLKQIAKAKTVIPKTPEFVRRVKKQLKQCKTNEIVAKQSHKAFKALPLNESIFSTVTGVPPRKLPNVTKPQPFTLLSDQRAQRSLAHNSEKSLEKEEGEQFVFKARPVPKYKTIQPIQRHETKIEVKPFRLLTDLRGKHEEEHIKEEIEKKKEEETKVYPFKALSTKLEHKPFVPVLPSSSGLHQPIVPKPFHLHTEERVLERTSRKHSSRPNASFSRSSNSTQNETSREKTTFKARQATVLRKPPFVPQKSTRPLTKPVQFVIHSDLRAEERKQFEERQKQRLMKEKEERERKKKEEERRLMEEEERFREEHKFRAQPIRASFDHPTFVPTLGRSKLTEAATPHLMTKERAAVKLWELYNHRRYYENDVDDKQLDEQDDETCGNDGEMDELNESDVEKLKKEEQEAEIEYDHRLMTPPGAKATFNRSFLPMEIRYISPESTIRDDMISSNDQQPSNSIHGQELPRTSMDDQDALRIEINQFNKKDEENRMEVEDSNETNNAMSVVPSVFAVPLKQNLNESGCGDVISEEIHETENRMDVEEPKEVEDNEHEDDKMAEEALLREINGAVSNEKMQIDSCSEGSHISRLERNKESMEVERPAEKFSECEMSERQQMIPIKRATIAHPRAAEHSKRQENKREWRKAEQNRRMTDHPKRRLIQFEEKLEDDQRNTPQSKGHSSGDQCSDEFAEHFGDSQLRARMILMKKREEKRIEIEHQEKRRREEEEERAMKEWDERMQREWESGN
ncbi:uncharacterized protein MONOS_6323 [Monocercomonoides exilis]|uniref:uncharacterized protein n=1 Tax=Monocercomonoides exilis TaxID=2049356 RepID=UPI003559CDB4|nr:hypothetical protein MONOS_6323 [Monocercomonoides exilis]|eukprot:MONOS_6323.1-p1 / transcript=MONOS_6323.1 / gene=MONOS_6323 / organism=Monocercomonoides_exilis_PA203 / gene_product=unspecified product / transcript_product=unspecified product / location=Mono_scaffold00197:78688-81474(+) / protein_length=803 / sequence_SO=supercontig / SO=protein_coding / is_pseudo=false